MFSTVLCLLQLLSSGPASLASMCLIPPQTSSCDCISSKHSALYAPAGGICSSAWPNCKLQGRVLPLTPLGNTCVGHALILFQSFYQGIFSRADMPFKGLHSFIKTKTNE